MRRSSSMWLKWLKEEAKGQNRFLVYTVEIFRKNLVKSVLGQTPQNILIDVLGMDEEVWN